ETGTFLWGYHNSKKSPMTLDGVTEDMPSSSNYISTSHKKVVFCRHHVGGNPNNPCDLWGATNLNTAANLSFGDVSITKSLYADLLQELGIKYHFVNVYNAYREAGAPNTDKSSTLDLFLAPFKASNLSSPAV